METFDEQLIWDEYNQIRNAIIWQNLGLTFRHQAK
jgi:hypothetical protein